VDLLPASDDPPYFEDGSVIPIEQTSIPVSTQELLTTVDTVLAGVPPEALRGAVDSLGLGLTGTGDDLATIFNSTADLARTFAETSDEVQGILEEGTKVGRVFIDTRTEFATAVRELVTVGEALAESTGDLERLLRGTNTVSDEVLALIRQHRSALNNVVRDLGEINAFQADHQDDLNRLLANLPDALQGVADTFEPDTGMVRFGLITEERRPGCSYGTERRKPEDRGHREIPHNRTCETGEGLPIPPGPQPLTATAPNSVLGGLAGLTGQLAPPRQTPVLPSRMADWSWTLFYLNVM
jgi:phospholipid/cholesterol/gamma-HCH transport system substrate-binding protein